MTNHTKILNPFPLPSRFLTDFSFETGNSFPGSPVWITIDNGCGVDNYQLYFSGVDNYQLCFSGVDNYQLCFSGVEKISKYYL
ncbi:hypothetical protein IM676_03265 [Anabaenopsis elenkinii CCIBt3563]|uniref:Uncharacterized protein n=1 Tax=Anabaenopsis elenkinii CCIBt3563 TaxID=2779889 RepID=A0A7S6TZQ0_9CYAN|nr:hypothetical protein IM676_03265 [Anabaenopsis elenkinii CCIBt3563]